MAGVAAQRKNGAPGNRAAQRRRGHRAGGRPGVRDAGSPAPHQHRAAQRELEEETGLQAEHWQLLNRIDTTPGFCNERIAIYLATGLSQHPSHPDADEFLQLTRIPLDDAVAQCMNGSINDSKTLVGLLMAQRVLQEQAGSRLASTASIQRINGAASSLCGQK